MAENEQPTRPAPRKETMQASEVDARLTPHFFPDYNRSVLAVDSAHARDLLAKELENEEVTKEQSNG